jgi:hypothetical protein
MDLITKSQYEKNWQPVSFSKFDVDKISNLVFVQHTFSPSDDKMCVYTFKRDPELIGGFHKYSNWDMKITKIPDEWFLIKSKPNSSIVVRDMMNMIKQGTISECVYYKADQIEDLMVFVKSYYSDTQPS